MEAIKRGYKTLTEISNFTGIPKTTTYRRLKKLTSLGYLQETKEYGKVYYDLNLRTRGTRTKINKGIAEKMRYNGKGKKNYNSIHNSCKKRGKNFCFSTLFHKYSSSVNLGKNCFKRSYIFGTFLFLM
jgi:Fe2+ or Zn2+ uptake regulation protein